MQPHERSFTVLTAELSHESNTFSRVPTDLDAFEKRYCLVGDAAIHARRHANTELAGFMDVADERGWSVLHALSAAAGPAGPVTYAAFEHLCSSIVGLAERHRHELDGVLLGLHGAMVSEHYEDADGELLRRLRVVIGPDMPISITLDPHANVTDAMCRHANSVVALKTYPHVDMRVSARQAADILDRTMRGEIVPATLRAHRPMLEEVNGGRTDIGPMVSRIADAREYERRHDVFAVSINAGFGNVDIAEMGPTVLVTHEGDPAPHRDFAEHIADDIWDERHNVLNSYLSVTEAASVCRAHPSGSRPIVVADYADNPGAGAHGDATALLAALLDAGVSNACFGPLVDPEAAAIIAACTLGDTVTVQAGGKIAPEFGGPPLLLTGRVHHISQSGQYIGDGAILGGLERRWGTCAVLQVQGIDVLIVSIALQILDLQQFRAFGIEPIEKAVVAVKSMQHFRAAFEPIADRVIVCDSHALCTPSLHRMPYKRVRRPVFPLDALP